VDLRVLPLFLDEVLLALTAILVAPSDLPAVARAVFCRGVEGTLRSAALARLITTGGIFVPSVIDSKHSRPRPYTSAGVALSEFGS
jgi:hypothetical protein